MPAKTSHTYFANPGNDSLSNNNCILEFGPVITLCERLRRMLIIADLGEMVPTSDRGIRHKPQRRNTVRCRLQ